MTTMEEKEYRANVKQEGIPLPETDDLLSMPFVSHPAQSPIGLVGDQSTPITNVVHDMVA